MANNSGFSNGDYSKIYEDYTGNGNYPVKKIGAYHMIGDDDYEPQRSNNFEIHIYGLNNLVTIDKNIQIGQDTAQDCLTLSVANVGSLQNSMTPIVIPYGNTKVKYAGLPDISNVSIVYNDYIGKATECIISAWFGQVFNPKTQKIGRATEYKKPGLLIETAPDGSSSRVWQLKGCWPSAVQYGNYDYNTAAVRQITMTLEIDIMIPLDGDDSEFDGSKRLYRYKIN